MSPAAAQDLARRFLDHAKARPDPSRPAVLLLLGIGALVAQVGLLIELLEAHQILPGAEQATRIDVVVVDQMPPDAAALQAAWERPFQASRLLRDATPWRRWPCALPGLHRIALGAQGRHQAGPLRLTLAVGPAARLLPRLALAADLIVLDAQQVSPGTPPWSDFASAPAALARLLAPGGRLLTRAGDALGAEMLASGGWHAESADAWRAWQPGRALARAGPGNLPAPVPVPAGGARRVAIVGAGLAGSACAAVFAARGWQVTLIDAAPVPQPGSGQPLLADHLHLSPDDNPTARLSRQALWLSQPWREAAPIGRFQMADSDEEIAEQKRAVAGLGHGAGALAVPVTRAEAIDLTGVRVARGGLWLPACGMSAPIALCASWTAGNPAIEHLDDTPVTSLRREDEMWVLHDDAAREITRAPVVILANAADAPRLAGLASVSLQPRHGRAVAVSAPALRGLRSVLGGSAYACPMGEATALVGLASPTAETPDLARLAGMLPELGSGRVAPRTLRVYEGWRHATPDRLPLIGALPDEADIRRDSRAFARNDRLALPTLPGLYMHAALGARGLVWSMLGAELLADLAEGCAPPIESDLIRALAPERFLRQALRRARLR
ncbi:MAG: FAD-dependent 5-carboxymethylaminomethyl-2-thiouridine(34) oxidoreductase MnmC [Burkholderiales bacterium]